MNIVLNDFQAKIICDALDSYSRIESGQFHIALEKSFDVEKVRGCSDELKIIKRKLLGLQDNAYLGIGSLSESSCCAYDMHQILRKIVYCDARSDFIKTSKQPGIVVND